MGSEEIDAIAKVINSGKMWRYLEDSESKQFEEEIKMKVCASHSLILSSGTAGLICALVALGIGMGDEVIVPGYTFISTALAPMALGAVPIIAEIDETLTISPEDIKKKITPRTRAIIAVHINGLPCKMDEILKIARENNILVVEDACQAVGGKYKGKNLGTIGDAGAYSFNYYKIISCGEGGAFVTNSTKLYEKARIYHDAGCAFFAPDQKERTPYFAGVNYRMSEILSAMMRVQLKRLDGILSDLRERKAFIKNNLCTPLGWKLSPVNDEEGDCSIKLGILFESNEDVLKCIKKLNEIVPELKVECPLNSDRHVYTNWEAVIKERGLFKLAREEGICSHDISKFNCPNTNIYLGRTLYIIIDPNIRLHDLSKICKNVTHNLKIKNLSM